jgi:hypothetical protein
MMQDFSFVHKYFMAEKQAGLLFLIVGSMAVILAVVFFCFIKSNPLFYKGMAVPLIIIGLLQLIVGITVFGRCDKQRTTVAYQMGMDPGYVKNTEAPRMEKVMKGFTVYKITALVLLIAGIVLMLLYRTDMGKQFWYGLGMALVIQSAITFASDWMAASRATEYLYKLNEILRR